MPYFAAALARGPAGWSGTELDLKEIEDLDGVLDELRQVDDDADTVLMFVEENDEWFGVVRVDEDGDPRVFLSDGRAMETSDLASLLGEAATVTEPVDDDDDDDDDEDEDEEEAVQLSGDPIGDSDLLADLGTPSARLIELCGEEGQLPADIITVLCESAGCLDTIDALRIA